LSDHTCVLFFKEFLLRDELTENKFVRNNSKPHVRINNLSCAWNVNTLQDITFEVNPKELVGVIGPVGSGKSSLLMALLGEMPNMTKDSIDINGSVFYVSQEPWIFSATIKENILFGKAYVKDKFDDIISACSLTEDLEMLPNGQDTFIGEKGVNLSGGQRARISLARALYSDADIYLLDDPLSAVDAHVAKHLYNE
jgi:ATP-binding cassette subfamily C (CFTR/MRP) protein 4